MIFHKAVKICLLLFLELELSLGIQFQQDLSNQTYYYTANRQNYQGFHLQFQYQPDVGGPWLNWKPNHYHNQYNPSYPRPTYSSVQPQPQPQRPGGHGSATPVQSTQVMFPGPVNNATMAPISSTTPTSKPIVQPNNNNNKDTNPNAGLGVNVNSNCKCGVVPSQSTARTLERITGGMLSKENAWPWMAAIVFIGSEAPFWFCGASLISDRYLITAAHCQRTIRRKGIQNIRILMGTNGIPSKANAAELFEISELRTHPLYKPNIEEYDIGLIKLKQKVTFTENISPICLTQRGTPFTERMATVAGWGSITHGDSPPDALREVEIKVVPNSYCQREYMYNYGTRITGAMLCAWLPGKDSCQGDSGGPLFLKTTGEPQVYTQIGVVSFGPPQCGQTTIPGVYTRIASTIRWLKANTRDSTYCSGAF